MKNGKKPIELNDTELSVIVQSLNQTWNASHERLTSKQPLGDIEREQLEWTKKQTKELMERLELERI